MADPSQTTFTTVQVKQVTVLPRFAGGFESTSHVSAIAKYSSSAVRLSLKVKDGSMTLAVHMLLKMRSGLNFVEARPLSLL